MSVYNIRYIKFFLKKLDWTAELVRYFVMVKVTV